MSIMKMNNLRVMKSILKYTLMAAISVAAMSSCQPKKIEKSISGSAIIACDETFQKVMEQIIPVFEFQYPDAAIMARYMPEDECFDSLMNKNVNLIVANRELTASEKQLLEAQKRTPRETMIAVDAIAIICNDQNPIDQISVDQLRKILNGTYTDWSQLDSSNTTGEITVLFDYQGSSTINYLKRELLDGADIRGNVFAQNSNARVFDDVQKLRGAIGIIGVSWVSSDMSKANMTAEELYNDSQVEEVTTTTFSPEVKVLPVAKEGEVYGYQPYQAYIYDGSYPLVRKVYMIVTGYTGSLQQAFYAFVTGFTGQKLIQTTGVLPGAITPRIVQVE